MNQAAESAPRKRPPPGNGLPPHGQRPRRRHGGLYERTVLAASRRSGLVVLLYVVLAIAGLAAAAMWLKVDTDPNRMISSELPFRRAYSDLVRAFPQLDNSFVAIVEAQKPADVRAAARAVEQSFRARPDLFSHVHAPALSPMFDEYGPLWLQPKELEAMVERLRQAAPMLGALAERPNLQGLSGLVGELAPAAAAGRAPPALTGFFTRLGDTVLAEIKGVSKVFDWENMNGGAGREGPARIIVLVKPKLDFSALDPAAAALEEARAIASDPEITGIRGVRVWLTGEAAMNAEEFETVTKGAGLAGLASLVFVTLVMILGMPAIRLVVPAIVMILLGFALNTGFATASVGQLNMISVAFAVLFIGLGVDYVVHFLLRWAEEARHGCPPARAMAITASHVGPALALGALTTALAFLAFTPTDFVGMAQLGIISAGGILIAFVATLTLVPAVLARLPLPRKWLREETGHQPRWRGLRMNFPRLRLAAVIVIVLASTASAVLVPQVRFDGDPVNLKDPSSPAVIAFRRLLQDDPGVVYPLNVLVGDARSASILAGQLRRLPRVGEVRTAKSFIPKEQTEKLRILRQLRGIVPARVRLDRTLDTESRLRSLTAMARHLLTIQVADAAPLELRQASRRLRQTIELFLAERGGDAKAVARLEDAIFARLPGLVQKLNRLARARELTLETMDPAIRALYIAPDGRWRLEVAPAGALDTEQAMRSFVSAVRAVAPAAAGAPTEIIGAADVVSRAMAMAAAVALVVVVVVVLAVLRSLVAMLLVLAPIVLSALLLVGYTVLFDAPFNFANVIVIPLLLGLGVDSAIHYVHRAREEEGGLAVSGTSTPRAIIISALTTIGSFGSLWLTPHRGMSSMGELLTVAIALTLLTTLVVLPQLIDWTIGRKVPGQRLDRARTRRS